LTPECIAVFEAIEDGICIQSMDSRIVHVNQAFAAILGRPREDVIGRTCSEIFDSRMETGIMPHFCRRKASEESGQSEEGELSLPGPVSGFGQLLRSKITPLRNAAGVQIGYVLLTRDVGDITARERELHRVEHLARFGELTAGLAHEIKNPLAGIQGVVDILLQRRGPHDPERSALEGIRSEVQRIDALVRTLLDRARPRNFNIQPASLTDTVSRAISLARHHAAGIAAKQGHQIQVEFINEAEPIVMEIDAVQIEDAVLNLVANAIEAIEGQGAVTVRLHKRKDDQNADEIIIEVKDNGRGIAEENLTRIFSPFFTTHPNGTGLGLPAVRRIARAHGGRVEVASTIGVGSIFTLTLRLPQNSPS
jgi:PAS domain S-box-containing protein